MTRKIIQLTLILCLFGISGICLALPQVNYQYPGIYAELNGGVAVGEVVDIFSNDDLVDKGFGYNFNLGYQFNPYFALESGYTGYFMYKYVNGADIALKGILPLDAQHRFNIFVKLGGSFLFGSGSTGGGVLGGIGMGFGLTKNLDLTLQFQGVTDILGSIGLGSLGLTYHFA